MAFNRRILIVDDDDGIRKTYFNIFRSDYRSDILSEESIFSVTATPYPRMYPAWPTRSFWLKTG